MTVSFRALGTTAVVAAADAAACGDAVAVVAGELDAVDRTCSRFRADSELVRACAAGGHRVRASPLLTAALSAALEAAERTGGLVDPTVGRALRLAGYDATFSVVAKRDGRAFQARSEPAPGWQVVELDRGARTVRIPAGVELDLGATAKAFAADRCARLAAEQCACGILVSLGGDVAVAGEPPPHGWAIGIADDHAAMAETTVSIRSGGLATSSTVVRRWLSGSETLHHLIDPRTGRPAESRWRTVSVAAASCLDANVASTAAVLLDGHAAAWLERRGLDARLVAHDGSSITTGRWPSARGVAA